MKPVLLVDVDGVLNAIPMFVDMTDPRLYEASYEAEGFSIRQPKGTRKRMAYLDGVYDCVWCTTWNERAPEKIAPHIGVGADWPVLQLTRITPLLPSGQFATSWKLPSIWKWADEEAPDRRIAWLDDDINRDAIWWKKHRQEERLGEVTTECPDPDAGLQAKHVRNLRDFACGR